ncbi:MAG: peptidylprolyl isomerase [Lentisphaeria bacterium]|nr:MAG: peptidylprolyl isomerase [Lentisphaeria bacterium]
MRQNRWMVSLFAAGAVAFSAGAADAVKPAPAKAAPAEKADAKKAPEDVWKLIPATVAEVDGKSISKDEFVKFLLKSIPDGKIPEGLTAEMIRKEAPGLVKQMVLDQLITAQVEKAGIKPSYEMAKAKLDERFKSFNPQQLEMIKMQMAQSGKDFEKLLDEQAKNPQIQKDVAIGEFLQKTVMKTVKVTDEEVRKYYEENKATQFTEPADQPDTVRASHILIMAEEGKAKPEEMKAALEKATKLMELLKKNPEKFEETAKAESQCPSSRQGGSLGAFGKGQMVPEFEKAAFELKEGELAGPVKTKFGYHIIRRDAAKGPTVTPFETIKPQLTKFLESRKQQQAFMEYIKKLEEEHKVKYTMPLEVPQLPGAVTAPAAK